MLLDKNLLIVYAVVSIVECISNIIVLKSVVIHQPLDIFLYKSYQKNTSSFDWDKCFENINFMH